MILRSSPSRAHTPWWLWSFATVLLAGCADEPADPSRDTSPASTTPAATEAIADAAAEAAVPWTDVPAPAVAEERPLNAGFLVIDGVYNTELTAPYDLFHHVRFHAEPAMEVFTVSPDGEPVTTFEGLRIAADYSFAEAPDIDVLVVPSAEHNMDTDLEDEALITWVRETGEKALYVVSLCDGSFVLAAAGLLDGLASTTFPGDQDRFAEMFPHLDLRRGPSFVHDGKAVTSNGGARSFDPAMYLVHHLYGETVAQGVGRGMVIPWPPLPGSLEATVIAPPPP